MQPLSRGSTEGFPFWKLKKQLPKATRAKFLESDRLVSFISISKFCRLKNPLAIISSLSELHFRHKFNLLVKKREVISIWQQHNQLKTIEMDEVLPDTYNDGYMHQFQPRPFTNWKKSHCRTNIRVKRSK